LRRNNAQAQGAHNLKSSEICDETVSSECNGLQDFYVLRVSPVLVCKKRLIRMSNRNTAEVTFGTDDP
jgi:hypothetical protein